MKKNNFIDKFKKVIWVLTPFILITIIFMLLFRCCSTENIDYDSKRVEGKDIVVDGVIVKQPTNNCRAHFSGLLMNDSYLHDHNSLIFITDEYSEYVGEGNYPRAKLAFPRAHETTFDGIAIDKKTRIIIYKEENFKGDILLDINGPAIINNVKWEGDSSLDNINNRTLKSKLEGIFPKNCRKFSKSNMHTWSNGSLKVICNE